MKTCGDFKNAIMLEVSGELARRYAVRLKAHLRACPACRAWHADYQVIGRLAPVSLPRPAPAEETTRRIVAEAGAPDAIPLLFATWAKPAFLAAAAAILIVAGIWRWNTWQNMNAVARTSQRAQEVHALATLISGATDANTAMTSATAAADPMRELARQLLILQGLDGEATVEEEVVTPGVEPLPTTLRERNIHAFHATSHV